MKGNGEMITASGDQLYVPLTPISYTAANTSDLGSPHSEDTVNILKLRVRPEQEDRHTFTAFHYMAITCSRNVIKEEFLSTTNQERERKDGKRMSGRKPGRKATIKGNADRKKNARKK
jgi:hypothetical protein